MNRVALLMLVPLLAGCEVHSKNPAGNDATVSIKSDDGGHIAFNLPIVQGKVKVPQSMMHHGNFDIDGVKLMPGSTVTGFSVFAGDKGSTVTMAFSAPGSADQVRAYYVDEFKKQGIAAALAGDTVTGKSKDGSPFTIQIASAGNGSKGTIVVHDKG